MESPLIKGDNLSQTKLKDFNQQRNSFIQRDNSKKDLESLEKLVDANGKLKKRNSNDMNMSENNSNLQRNSHHLSVAHINKIAQLNMLYVKNQKKKFNAEKYLLPQIKLEPGNQTGHDTMASSKNTINIKRRCCKPIQIFTTMIKIQFK